MSRKKYELTDETRDFYGVTLHRIRALIDIPRYGVKAGDLGGFVRSEANLSNSGIAWVGGDACVSEHAFVGEHALVGGDAEVGGHAWVGGSARVGGDAEVRGRAFVSGDAEVGGHARISEHAFVGGDAEVRGDARVSRTPKVLTGFKHNVTVTDHHIAAGCEIHPPSVWQERGAAIIRSDGASRKDAKAQAKIINLIAAQHGCTDVEIDQ